MQNDVKEFIQKYNLEGNYQIKFTDLVSEVGELGKELIKGSNYGSKEYKNTDDLELELGDCLFSLLALSEELGIDSNKALKSVLSKYKKRFDDKGNIGS